MRRTPLKRGKGMRKKTSARKVKQAHDLRVKEEALVRDAYRCCRCQKDQGLQAAHILPKGLYPRMRFVVENILTLCIRCHLFFAHKDPLAFAAWLHETYPGLEERLREQARTAPKVDLKELAAQLEER